MQRQPVVPSGWRFPSHRALLLLLSVPLLFRFMAHRQPVLASLAKPLLVTGLLLSGLFLIVRPASAGGKISFCNETDQDIWYATHSGRNNRPTKGWYKIDAGKCREAIGITWSYPSSGPNPYPETTTGYFHAESPATNTHWPPRNSRNQKYCVGDSESFEIQYDSGGKRRDIASSSNPQWSASCKGLGESYRTERFVEAPITEKWVDRQWPIRNETHERKCNIFLRSGGNIKMYCGDWKKFGERAY